VTHPLVWSTSISNVRHAVNPPVTSRPNPVAAGSLLAASIFSPGAVCVLDRNSGGLGWRRPLDGLGHSDVCVRGAALYAHSLHTLYAFELATGRPLWTFSPYGAAGAWLYSSAPVEHDRLF